MNKSKWFVALIALSLVLGACTPTTNSAPAQQSITEDQDPLPDEQIGSVMIDWQKKLADPETATLAIVAIGGLAIADNATIIGFADDPAAILTMTGLAAYAVYMNREQIAEAVVATVQGVEGLRDWVRENFQVVVPSEFRLEGGSVSIQAPGVSFQGAWSLNQSGGCNYDGYLNGTMLNPLTTEDFCSPADFLAWIASQLDQMRKNIGERADELLRALNDLIGPFVK